MEWTEKDKRLIKIHEELRKSWFKGQRSTRPASLWTPGCWHEYLKTLGIIVIVNEGDDEGGRRDPHFVMRHLWGHLDSCAIIVDPSGCSDCLMIPNETAEKILILGL